MDKGNSRKISSNQPGPHEKVQDLVIRHLANQSQKPFNQHTLEAFKQVENWRLGKDPGCERPIILDSCCGVGESTGHIANEFPEALVIGIDKSALRTNKHQHYTHDTDNYVVVRADVNDFWRLAHQAGWQLARHYLLYPNPYPKSAHVQRRWHGSAAFKDIVSLGGVIEVRSNWNIYIEEFAIALQTAGSDAQAEQYIADTPQTPFERKYWLSGQSSWRVVCQIKPQQLFHAS